MTLGSMELYRVVHTTQRQITTLIPIESCVFVIGLGLSLGHCQCDNTISPLTLTQTPPPKTMEHRTHPLDCGPPDPPDLSPMAHPTHPLEHRPSDPPSHEPPDPFDQPLWTKDHLTHKSMDHLT